MGAPSPSPEVIERLRTVVADWGREVAGAHEQLSRTITEAATELSQIEHLLDPKLREAAFAEMQQRLESLEQENQTLRDALAERDARIRALSGPADEMPQ